jgi:hypothetical protein
VGESHSKYLQSRGNMLHCVVRTGPSGSGNGEVGTRLRMRSKFTCANTANAPPRVGSSARSSLSEYTPSGSGTGQVGTRLSEYAPSGSGTGQVGTGLSEYAPSGIGLSGNGPEWEWATASRHQRQTTDGSAPCRRPRGTTYNMPRGTTHNMPRGTQLAACDTTNERTRRIRRRRSL